MFMKDPRFLISLIAVLALGGFGVAEYRTNAELNRQISKLKSEAEAQATAANVEAAKLQRKIEDGKQVIAQMDEARRKPAEGIGSEETANVAPGEGDKDKAAKPDFGSMMKKMFTDPNMKKVMRSQQMMVVKRMYSDLAKELGLTADQANQVLELLGERQMALAAKSMKLFGGEEGGAASAEETGKEVAATTEEYNAQLENLLGKDGMTKLSNYEKTAGDRMQMQQYKQAFSANGVPLDERQSLGLLGIMKEERLRQPASPLDPGAKDVGAAIEAMKSDDTFNQLMASQEGLDNRVRTRARNVLSPDQMVQFETIQKQQLEMQKMGMEMGRQFLKSK